jgi:AcrR family transcriptional regulator
MELRGASSNDRRVQRTRRLLRDALIALITERGWDKVSVQDVCERADVGRSTFYTHFADKEELLLGGFDDLRKVLRAQRSSSGRATGEPLAFVRGLIEHAGEHATLFRAIIGKRAGHAVEKRFRQTVLALVKEDLAAYGLGGRTLDVTTSYAAGALVEVLTWWIDTRNSLDAAELEAAFRRLTLPVLTVSRGLKVGGP